MLNRHLTMSTRKLQSYATLFQYKNARKNLNSLHRNICLCGTYYVPTYERTRTIETLSFKPYIRLHSTQSDQHRQKVVLETVTPKIVLEKVSSLEQKVLPDDKREKTVSWRDNVDPYIKLMRLDKPIGKFLIICLLSFK